MFAAALLFASSLNHLDARLSGSWRENKAGWVYVRLHGSPEQIGFEHGYWLEPEIEDMVQVTRLYDAHAAKGDANLAYETHRREATDLLWPKIPTEYRQELEGIAEGVQARGSRLTLEDIVYNAGGTDFSYYLGWLGKEVNSRVASTTKDHCSAIVATGSATRDGKIVMAHNCWTDYIAGERNNIILDITPERGHHILMDSWPGHLDSGDDFGINSAGIMITETTIAAFTGFDPKGVPEFVRMREAIQYGDNLDSVVKWFVRGNNGAYANMWLLADRKNNEIGKLELGLKNVAYHHAFDGAYTSSNYPEDPKLTAEECDVDTKLGSNPCSDRKARWAFLMDQFKGKIDAEAAKTFLGDHHDQILGTDIPNLSGLCGHGDTEPRGDHTIPDDPYAPMGSVQGKVVTSDLAAKMTFWARMGHPCGLPFFAAPFLSAHPGFAWQKPLLKDMPTEPWVTFTTRSR